MSELALSPEPQAARAPSPRGRSFAEVHAEVAVRGDLAFDDLTVPFSSLRATPEGNIAAPGRELALTDWSKRQLSRIFGMRWERWFDESVVSPDERADELNIRFRRTPGEVKVRARRHAGSEPAASDGVLRAFLSPSYGAIDDHRVFDRLSAVLGPRREAFRFDRVELTDAGSQYVAVAHEPVRSFDPHLTGFLVANSEVGARALTALVYLIRLVCSNGMTATDTGRFRRVHREAKDGALEAALSAFLGALPSGWSALSDRLEAARLVALPNPADTIEEAFREEGALRRRHAEAAVEAYRERPNATVWGVVQAITFAAQAFLADERLEMERFAGRFLAARVPR